MTTLRGGAMPLRTTGSSRGSRLMPISSSLRPFSAYLLPGGSSGSATSGAGGCAPAACGSAGARALASPSGRLLSSGLGLGTRLHPPSPCSRGPLRPPAAAALSVALQPDGSSGAAAGKGQPAAKPAHNGTGAGGRAPSASSYATVAATVAAQYPAVAELPPPPKSGQLSDVVPYLLKLALQEQHLAWRLAAAICCMIVAKMAGISLPLAFKSAVDSLASGLTPVALTAALWAVGRYCLLDCTRVVAKEAQSPFFAPVSQAVTRRVAYHTFAHVLDLDTRFHLDRRTGRVSRILERGNRSIAVLYRALVFTFLPTGIELGAVACLLAGAFGASLAAILGATFAAYVGWTVAVTQYSTDARKEVVALDNLTSSKAVDALLNYETVTLFNNSRLEVGLYDKHLRDFQQATLNTEKLSATLNAGQGLILAVGMSAILAAIIQRGSPAPGDLVMASGLIVQLWAPLQYLGWFYRELRSALVDMEEFFQILRTTSNIPDGDTPLPDRPLPAFAFASSRAAAAAAAAANGNCAASANGAPSASSLSHASSSAASPSSSSAAASPSAPREAQGLQVELVDVSFGYVPERQILRGVSLRVAPGESVAVVGSSGSGKSTILKLVTRLYDVWPDGVPPGAANAGAVEAGAAAKGGAEAHADDRASSGAGAGPSGRAPGVYLNGVDVRRLKLADLRSAIAVVPQDTALNYESIKENIRYGRPDATDAEVEEAARLARLHDTILSMQDGYDTIVGERGLKLSGGEKQRVAIARAFLRSPRLLICDEATSALDSATEAAIMRSLEELAAGRSALFVAHRLSTVRNCDRIVVLREGRVVEEGSHDQLMELGGEYAAMWALQAAKVAAGVEDGGVTDEEDLCEPPHGPGLGSGHGSGHGGSGQSGPGLSGAAVAAPALASRDGGALDSVDDVSGAGGVGRRAAAAAVAAAASAAAAVTVAVNAPALTEVAAAASTWQ
ncbi:hypothetical protein HYH03_018666 [Edaphochlamys debaryana]|uniref:Uncharacterized protein n=1 Tax=Edaphochlamys debaryana TaxID=47281 RepID=A0A835XJU0_9CHLO|nr:hypothetical protein HYH03_018666 [Edaphochlamys debaryana]|eukprot:KAG2482405.1 hypothetical protein HYH03_018666 [Edaphochlamys debaryana]